MAKSVLDVIRKKLPKGAVFPEALNAIASAVANAGHGDLGYLRLEWTAATLLLDVKPAAARHVVPFAAVSSGDLIAVWWEDVALPPRVVVLGAHGEEAIAFTSLESFLSSWVGRTTGVPDLDEGPEYDRAKALGATPAEGPSAPLAKQFGDWVLAERPKTKAIDPVLAENLRAAIVRIVFREALASTRMPRWNGPDDVYRQWRLMVDPKEGVTWHNGGKVPFPAMEELREPLETLLAATGQRGKAATVTVDSEGRVFPDRRTTIEPA